MRFKSIVVAVLLLVAGTGYHVATHATARAATLLTQADITLLGAIRMPIGGTDTSFVYGGMAGRTVNGKLHFYVYANHVSNSGTIYEIEDPGTGYTTDYRNAPRATLVAEYDDIYHGHRVSYDAAGHPTTGPWYEGALNWNEANQLLYWTYNDGYNVNGNHNWGLGATRLDPPIAGHGTSTAFGPWRTAATDADGNTFYGTWRCLYLFPVSPDGTMMCGSQPMSGNASAPFGPDAYGGQAWPTAATPSGFTAPDLPLPNRYLEHYFMGNTASANYVDSLGAVHGALRSFRRRVDQALFENAGTATQLRVDPALNGGVGSWTEQDGTTGGAWLELTNKRGVIFTATVSGAVSQDKTDCVNASHEWYSTALNNHMCNHGCPDPIGVTGPVTTAAFPALMIYNPDDLLAVKNGTKLDYSPEPTTFINLERAYGLHTADIRVSGAGKTAGLQYFDATRKYLFLLSGSADDSRVGNQFLETLLYVFAINDTTGTTPPPPPPPPPAPVDCVVGAWTAWTPKIGSTTEEQRTRPVLTEPSNGGQLCPATLETRPIVIAPDPFSFTASEVTTECRFTTSAPDQTSGWRVQWTRNGVAFGKADSTQPYTVTALLPAGSYSFTATWTKSGQPTQVRTVVGVCK